MKKIYHSGNSVCSQKVRIALAEKGTLWQSIDIDMTKGEQLRPEYLALNPEGVVPTLVEEDGFVVRESSVIIDYLDQLKPQNLLMPTDVKMQTITRLWLIRTIEIHAAINSMSFATIIREQVMSKMGPEQIEKWVASNLNMQISEKRRDLMKNGAKSVYVDGALHTLLGMLRDMNSALNNTKWLTGDSYGLADTALTAYVDRLERLGMSGLWDQEFPEIARWLKACQERPSYKEAIIKYYPEEVTSAYRVAGDKAWPEIAKRISESYAKMYPFCEFAT